ncbi:uncharacterized protein LOC143378078 [Andrena cerasifolii]|uniref:uncharacterized protein LOC143378078 n=1 Tax=Andrena cerasifolii TaxID=2819439 RepID=UPI004038129B
MLQLLGKASISAHTSNCSSNPLPAVLLATAKVKVQCRDGGTKIVRALVDQGSEVSLLTEQLAQQLCLPRKPANIRIVGVGNQRTERVRGQIQLTFAAHFGATESHVITALVLPRITSYQPRVDRRSSTWAHLKDLALADPNFEAEGPIELLLGADAFAIVILEGIARGHTGEPVAQRTTLGWIVSGPASPDIANDTVTSQRVATLQSSSEEELLPLIRRFWEQEEVMVSPAYTIEEQNCEEHFKETHRRLPSGRYMVRLPLRGTMELGESRRGAKRMLLRMEAKFKREPAFAEAYHTFMREYSQLTHMSKVQGDLLGPYYYLPHHGVLKESSTTTRLRVVFNGSSLTTSGQSLNEGLMVGPNLLPSLQQLLLRWRVHRVCLTADIEKMYRQILIHPDDRRYQRVLWRESTDSDIQDFELNTVTYGLACAPYLAIRTLRQLASDEQARFPRAAAILQHDVYMDDVVTGADSLQEAAELQTELRQLCQAGGFNLRKWASNRTALMEQLPTGDAISECKWQAGETHTALGVRWSLADDSFRVHVHSPSADGAVTRRLVLSTIAKIFDPLGLVSPVTVNAKIFMQSLWLKHLDWDSPLPPAEAGYWRSFLEDLPDLNRITTPRWLGVQAASQQRELHGFADASERAYAAAIYLRVVDTDGCVRTQLITAKTKVAPLKRVSIPRLELSAATLLTKLMALTCGSLGLTDTTIHLWSDSTITLAWIQGHPTRWKTYVANRVSEIQRTLPGARWHHVASKDNPADCASRGLPPSQLPEFSLWWTGPAWLTSSADWSQEKPSPLPNTDLEARSTCHPASGEPATDENPLMRYSSLNLLLRITAWCLRWLPRKTAGARGTHLKPAEVNAARTHWLLLEQQREFALEIRQLTRGLPLSHRSNLLRLNPYLDDQGLLRVGGRLRHAALPLDAKHQFLLPRNSRLTELTRAVHLELISDYSTEAFLAALRRFTSRRGFCTVIQSDQGTTFVGAARELQGMLEHLNSGQDAVHSTLLRQGTEWRFNPLLPPTSAGFGKPPLNRPSITSGG